MKVSIEHDGLSQFWKRSYRMSDKILTAIIAASVSILVALISFFQNRKSLITQTKNIENQLNHGYANKLYDLRIEEYSSAFAITEKVKQHPTPNFINPPTEIKQILSELYKWKSGRASLIMSSNTINEFRKLRDALKKNPGNNDRYTEDQSNKILHRISRFRGSMRGDIGFLYELDEN